MKNGFKYLCLVVVLTIAIFTLVGCNTKSVITLTDLSLNIAPNGSIKHLSGDKSDELLGNIDRGFRLETYCTLGSGRAWPTDEGSDGYKMLEGSLKLIKKTRQLKFKFIFI